MISWSELRLPRVTGSAGWDRLSPVVCRCWFTQYSREKLVHRASLKVPIKATNRSVWLDRCNLQQAAISLWRKTIRISKTSVKFHSLRHKNHKGCSHSSFPENSSCSNHWNHLTRSVRKRLACCRIPLGIKREFPRISFPRLFSELNVTNNWVQILFNIIAKLVKATFKI